MCDSVFVLQLSVLPQPEPPTVTVEGVATLVSSAAKGNQWFRQDGTPVEGATGQRFTPTEDGTYYVAAGNGACYSEPSEAYRVQLTDRSELSLDLAEGWNWLSSNIADAQYRQAKDFLAPIAASVERMEGDGGELAADGQGGPRRLARGLAAHGGLPAAGQRRRGPHVERHGLRAGEHARGPA